jgi:hypothetical protein
MTAFVRDPPREMLGALALRTRRSDFAAGIIGNRSLIEDVGRKSNPGDRKARQADSAI